MLLLAAVPCEDLLARPSSGRPPPGVSGGIIRSRRRHACEQAATAVAAQRRQEGAVIIGPERLPRLQFDDDEPFAIDSCEVRRDLDRSMLANAVRHGEPVVFPPGRLVTLWTGESVVFQGRAVDESTVLDLISTESDDELSDDELI
jgi:hypothetical protein